MNVSKELQQKPSEYESRFVEQELELRRLKRLIKRSGVL